MSMRARRRQADRPPREEGAALVIVMVFMIGILGMLAFLIPMSQQAVVAESQSQRMQKAQFVLQSAVASVSFELRKLPFEEIAPVGDGQGAIGLADASGDVLTTLPTNDVAGVEVRDVAGRIIGRYLAIVDEEPEDGAVVHIVAGVPDLEVHDMSTASGRLKAKDQVILAARIKVQPDEVHFFADRNALAFAGPTAGTSATGSGNVGFQGVGDSALKIRVDAYDGIHPPAVNISDAKWYDQFLENVVYDGKDAEEVEAGVATTRADLKGGHKNDSSDGDARYQYTVSQQPSTSQIVNEQMLVELSNFWREPASAANLADPNTTTWNGTSSETLSEPGLVHLTGNVDGKTLSGSGTLVITGRVEFKNGAKLNWDGDVIVAPSGNTKGALTLNGSEANINGNLVVAANPAGNNSATADLTVTNKGTLNVRGLPGDPDRDGGGSILVMQSGLATSAIKFEKGSTVDVHGVMGLLGNSVGFDIAGSTADGDSTLDVDGSLVIAVPNDSADGVHKFRIDTGGKVDLHFKNGAFVDGVENATSAPQFGQDKDKPPLPTAYSMVGYYETQASGVWPTEFARLLGLVGTTTENSLPGMD